MARAFNSRKRLYDFVASATDLDYFKAAFDLEFTYREFCTLLSFCIPHLNFSTQSVQQEGLYLLAGVDTNYNVVFSAPEFADCSSTSEQMFFKILGDNGSLFDSSLVEEVSDKEPVLSENFLHGYFEQIKEILLHIEFPRASQEWIDYTETGQPVVIYEDDLESYYGKCKAVRKHFSNQLLYGKDSSVATLVRLTEKGFIIAEGKYVGKVLKFIRNSEICYFPAKYEIFANGVLKTRPFEGVKRKQIFAVREYLLRERSNEVVTDDNLLDVTFEFL